MPLYLQLTTVSYLRSLGDNMLHCHLHCIQIWYFTYYMLSLRPVGQTKFVLVFFSKKLTGARALHSAQCYTRKPYWPKSETESITPSVYHTRALSGLLSASVVCVCAVYSVTADHTSSFWNATQETLSPPTMRESCCCKHKQAHLALWSCVANVPSHPQPSSSTLQSPP